MKVYVDNEDKDFLDACLSECKVYEYVADELQYSDRLKLVSLSDYTKQVRKEVIEKLKIESPYCHINCETYYKVYPEILEKIIGETDAKD